MKKMRGFILLGGLVMLVGCKSQKKATAEYEAYLAEVQGSTEKVDMEKGQMNTVNDSERNADGSQADANGSQRANSDYSWPGDNDDSSGSAIVVKQEEASLLSGEDGAMGNSKYYVIIGSFANENNARNYKQTMKDKGFNPVILENKSGYYRVAVFNSNDETDARNEIKNIRTAYAEHKDVWLLMKK